jgi:hypothetical protein
MGSDVHAQEAVSTSEPHQPPGFVYRISNVEEWKQAQEDGGLFGGQIDRTSRFVHLSTEQQVRGLDHFCMFESMLHNQLRSGFLNTILSFVLPSFSNFTCNLIAAESGYA